MDATLFCQQHRSVKINITGPVITKHMPITKAQTSLHINEGRHAYFAFINNETYLLHFENVGGAYCFWLVCTYVCHRFLDRL